MELVLLTIIVFRIFLTDFFIPWSDTQKRGRFVEVIKKYYYNEKYDLFLIPRKDSVIWERDRRKIFGEYYYMTTAVRWTSKGWEWARIAVYDSQQTQDAPDKPEDDIPILPERLTDEILDEGRKDSIFNFDTFWGRLDRVWKPLRGEGARRMIADFEKFLTFKHSVPWTTQVEAKRFWEIDGP